MLVSILKKAAAKPPVFGLALFTFGLFVFTGPTTVQAVFEGIVGGPIRTVMILGAWADQGPSLPGQDPYPASLTVMGGTSAAIAHKTIEHRCMATAAHVKRNRLVQKEDATRIVPADKDQYARTDGGQAGPASHGIWRDIRIKWMQQRTHKDLGGGVTDNRILEGDYASRPIAAAFTTGLPVTTGEVDIDNGKMDYTMRGYGLNAPGTGHGILRHGFSFIFAWIYQHMKPTDLNGLFPDYFPAPGKGSVMASYLVGPGHEECPGDSGAPLYNASKLTDAEQVGVFSSRYAATTCGDAVSGLYTAFNSVGEVADPVSTTNWADVGNWEQVVYLVNRICTKIVIAGVRGIGKVTGAITTSGDPLESYNDADRLDKNVDCESDDPIKKATGDCIESVHQGETLTLTAVETNAEWKFKEWASTQLAVGGAEGEEPPDRCECKDGLGVNPCVVEYPVIGDYGPDHSDDVNTCIAVFVHEDCGNENIDGDEVCDTGGINTSSCDLDCTAPACGDRLINKEAGEECDDGNTDNGDGCSSACLYEGTLTCGDGFIDVDGLDNVLANSDDEECDDGNLEAGDGCSDICTTETCGNSVADFGEECDDGTESKYCDNDCTLPVIGDGVLNTTAGEECDDGNTVSNDGCSAIGLIETGLCGDGNQDMGEQCDAGPAGGTNCNDDCTTAVCGDSKLNRLAGEDCDDGNTTAGDGCSELCALEGICGDGYFNQGEECDDSNTTSGDGCSSTCEVEFTCGDGSTENGEECDDGNTDNGDGCDSSCVIELTLCGDGNLDLWEVCDDGNTTNGDGCNSSCQPEWCGNEVVDSGEECDDGVMTAECTFNCTDSYCGDGIVNTLAGEQCEPGMPFCFQCLYPIQ